jgi:hypothetical protein
MVLEDKLVSTEEYYAMNYDGAMNSKENKYSEFV